MKLYTEENIRKAWNTAYTDALSIDEPEYKPKFYEDFIQSITPIELPSDEEIFEIAPIDLGRGPSIGATEAFRMGAKWMRDRAKWMRDKIKGGNQ